MEHSYPTNHPLYPYDWFTKEGRNGKTIPLWRGLVQSETGLDHLLRKLPPEIAERVLLLNSQGRAALEGYEWRSAEVSFLEVKTVLEKAREKAKVGAEVEELSKVYHFLLAWAYLPLAELYQSLGNFGAEKLATLEPTVSGTCTEMLTKALFWRRQILDCVGSLGGSPPHLRLLRVCRTYFCTALYELGDLIGDSQKKKEGVDRLAGMLKPEGVLNIVEVEACLCFYLWCDHYYISGNLEVSRKWIRRANRLWRETNCNWNSLQIEVELSMKLGKFEEAEEVLQDSMPYFRGDHQQNIRRWLRQCQAPIQSVRKGETGGDFHQADALYSADLRSQPNDTRVPNTSNAPVNHWFFGTIPASHPLVNPSPFSVGSSLGLVHADFKDMSHLQKLPRPISKAISDHLRLAQDACSRFDWLTELCNFQICREFLKLVKKTLDPKAYDWLLSWLDLRLARLYQYRVKKAETAVEIWNEMRQCAMRLLPSDEYLTRGYTLNLDVAEFEWKRASNSGEHVEVVRRRAAEPSSPASNEKAAERELCFWLYCHHYCHGNYEISSEWLQEAKRLRDEHRPGHGQKCSSDPQDYFCCEYTFLRCEADLCMRLQNFEKAISTLIDLLETRHVVEGNPRLKREANQWLQQCLQSCGSTDELELEEITDEAPSPAGCYFIFDPTVHYNKLDQSKIGLEHHLHKLPTPIHLAFRRYGEMGRINQLFCDWESAAFHYEWCKELLKWSFHKIEWSGNKVGRATYDWLVVWADVPLVEIYGFAGKNRHRRALDLVMWEMLSALPEDSEGDSDVILSKCLLEQIFMFMYQCAVSDYPELKEEVIKSQAKLWGVDDYWGCEERNLLRLHRGNFIFGNYEASWKYIHELNERLPEGVQDDKKYDYLSKEVVCCLYLGRVDEARKLTRECWEKSGKTEDELPATMQVLLMELGLGRPEDEGLMKLETRMSVLASGELTKVGYHDNEKSGTLVTQMKSQKLDTLVSQLQSGSEIFELRRKSHEKNPELSDIDNLEEEIKRLESILEIYDGGRWDSRQRYPTTAYKSEDYMRLGTLHMAYFYAKLPSLSIANIEDVQQDKHFSGAVKYFKKCMELPLPHILHLHAAEANYALVLLYGKVDEHYGSFLRKLYLLLGPHREQLLQLQRQQSSASSSSSSASSASQDGDIDLQLRKGICLLIEKIEDYLAFQNPMDGYGKVASARFTNSLYTMVNQRNTEGWIQTLETFSDIYSYLQCHYYRKVTFARILELCFNHRRDKFASISRSDLEHSQQSDGSCPYCKNPIEINPNAMHTLRHIHVPQSSSLASKTSHMNIARPSLPSQVAVDCGKEAVDVGRQAAYSGKEAVDSGKKTMDKGKEAVDRGKEAVHGGREVFASVEYSSKVKMLSSERLKDERPRDIPDIEDLTWKAFIYAERERSRVMLYEVGSDRLNYSAASRSKALWTFDGDDAMAVDSIRRDCSTLLQDGAVFVQYSRLTDQKTYIIYVVDQQGKLTVTHTIMEDERAGPPHTIEGSLRKLLKFLEPQNTRRRPVEPVDKPPMLKELEYLYDVLIKPIADRLAKMKVEQKLILAPTKLLWQVPFAALRNKRTGEYLIQRHTIATTTSLRTLKVCSDRLKALQSSEPSNIGLGSIVALGHPAYRICDDCDPGLPLLEQSAKEVEHIANLFNGRTTVVKQLLWEQATAEELLDWAARPSREGFRQALVHIGSHAEVSDGKNVLHLACPHAKPVQNDAPTVTDDKQSTEFGRAKLDYEAEEDENQHEGEEDHDENHEEGGEDENHDKGDHHEVASAIMRLTRTRYNPNRFSEQSLDVESRRGSLVTGGSPTGTIDRSADPPTRSYAGSHDLKAEDIWSSEWRAELVVLSACSTSRGKGTAVEGVLSLARAFITSGVPCAVASLWRVDDKATSTLMKMFYDELRKEGTDVASALCSAMRKGLDPTGPCKFPVKFWAPFLVYGVPTLCLPTLPDPTLEESSTNTSTC